LIINQDVNLNGENNCDPGATCNLKLERTVKIIVNDGEVVNADYQEDVNYVQECAAGLTCNYEDSKEITCTVNGCEVTAESIRQHQQIQY
jgi:hypothetical protein